jgi:hypothetical protein
MRNPPNARLLPGKPLDEFFRVGRQDQIGPVERSLPLSASISGEVVNVVAKYNSFYVLGQCPEPLLVTLKKFIAFP